MMVVASAASRQILAERHAADVDSGVEEGLQRDRRGDLAGADQVARDLIDLLMDRIEEMLRIEEIGDPVEGLVIDQDGAQQRLLRLDIVWAERKSGAGSSTCLRAVESAMAMDIYVYPGIVA